MALFAYMHAFGQTNNYIRSLIQISTFTNIRGNFAERQLQYGAILEYNASHPMNGSSAVNNEQLSEKTLFHLIFGDNYSKSYEEFQNYLLIKNFSSVYDYVYSFAEIACYIGNYTRFVRHLIRYGRVCQVNFTSFIKAVKKERRLTKWLNERN